ncbi:hypothetical protein B9Q01_01915 [Candidatus Marsarchaeota G1 archaeon OSP_D]|jgi:hypothetical protein|uniref:HEPN domain-containing protein n=3 Tax=Candidatus Marsarchaeota group 1 TaxID=2203770 RepID=A0A2R6AJK2_9ARCH|nr:MAG: hypothetical protein B9Q01_01915 [Candidatus Marsarchaeota G1 archaeon OSP_D]PSN86523.1 MAG: hypothetical protein B9Q02_02095 [Candidatus Marsarchaeota G1 archaeon BE_D]PSN89217.1 MAG: hypothetical protein B9Q00_02380 [Candidatus Marsarchaeota G1 archaeon OSP_C]
MLLLSAADVYLNEADELLSKGDVVQACEKYYKAAEEAVKMLAVKLNMTDLLNKVKEQGEWDATTLDKIVIIASKILKDEKLVDRWNSALVLHTTQLNLEPLKEYAQDVSSLVKLADTLKDKRMDS